MAAVSPSRQLSYGVQWNCSVLVGGLLAACHAGPAPPARETTRFLAPPAAVLLGRWEYVPPARLAAPLPPTLGMGLQVMLELDSAAGRTAYGRVGRWFSGDVGIRGSAFGPVTVVASRRGGDTLVIDHARQGNDAGPFAAGPGVMFLRTAARVRP